MGTTLAPVAIPAHITDPVRWYTMVTRARLYSQSPVCETARPASSAGRPGSGGRRGWCLRAGGRVLFMFGLLGPDCGTGNFHSRAKALAATLSTCRMQLARS